MAEVEALGRTEMTFGPVFRRVVQTTTANLVDSGGPMEQIDGPARQNLPIPIQQSVDSVPKKDAGCQKETVKPKSRLIVAVDFGTTYSTVSYAKVDPNVDSTTVPISDIRCINKYKHADGHSDARSNCRAENVPTKLLYLGDRTKAPDSEPSDTDPETDECLSDVGLQPTPTPDRSGRKRRKRGRKAFVATPRQRPRTTWSRAAGVTVRWGFPVQFMQRAPEELIKYKVKETVELIKLTLGGESGEDEDLQNKRVDLEQQIERLCKQRIIEDRDHLLRDYLVRLLQHTKAILNEDELLEETQMEYVLCVPVSWSEKACRTMHDAMVKAVEICKLGGTVHEGIPDLFIVSEPEAAAQYVIATLGRQGRLKQNEIFIILDAGGGTVDITTYKVTSDGMGPLRLLGEMIAPDGALCGSSLITERYLRKIREKIGEIDPTEDPALLDAEAIKLATEWDMYQKPRIDVADKKSMGLKGGRKRHKGKPIKWREDEIRKIFDPSLEGTIKLFEKQLRLAKEKNLTVSKLIVVGGFGESPSLRTRIWEVLSTCYNSNGEKIEAIWPKNFPMSALARGAVLRALDKRNGPSRISRSSFGFLHHERYGSYEEHTTANVVPTRDGVDHDEYVRNTIYWLIKKGQELHTQFRSEPIESCHTFDTSQVQLICVEELYVSQYRQSSHFQRDHKENEAASLLSFIKIDVTDLKHEFPLEEKSDLYPRKKGSSKYFRVVKFDLVIEVEGRQLKYEARWPAGAPTPEEVRIRRSGYVSLAPSFAPGTV